MQQEVPFGLQDLFVGRVLKERLPEKVQRKTSAKLEHRTGWKSHTPCQLPPGQRDRCVSIVRADLTGRRGPSVELSALRAMCWRVRLPFRSPTQLPPAPPRTPCPQRLPQLP